MDLLVAIVALALVFNFINGFRNLENIIRMSTSTRALTVGIACVIAGIFSFFGALTSTTIALSIGENLLNPFPLNNGLESVIIGMFVAILLTSITEGSKLQISSSQILIGALIGVFIINSGWNVINWNGFAFTILAFVLLPLMAFILGKIVLLVFKHVFKRAAFKANRGFKYGQILTTALVSFSYGGNNGQYTMGIITIALISGDYQSALTVPVWVQISCALALGVGTLLGGLRIKKTSSTQCYDVKPMEGFGADFSSFTILQGATLLGFPLSATQLTSSSILGVKSEKGSQGTSYKTLTKMVITSVLTLSISGVLASVVYLFFSPFI